MIEVGWTRFDRIRLDYIHTVHRYKIETTLTKMLTQSENNMSLCRVLWVIRGLPGTLLENFGLKWLGNQVRQL